ncbi:unnamed protein product [Pieris brassicae]|uniref:Uncharacterized protein n=1 Tax=Pieris brassicae TaxID=7116 RepID=A0A9P0WZZ7_PIEBR|nr:unnamed protein product [Pieris brassicae]
MLSKRYDKRLVTKHNPAKTPLFEVKLKAIFHRALLNSQIGGYNINIWKHPVARVRAALRQEVVERGAPIPQTQPATARGACALRTSDPRPTAQREKQPYTPPPHKKTCQN